MCFDNIFDYQEATELGYDWRSKFLAGLLPNSTTPTWKGKYGNSTFQKIQEKLYEKDFSKVTISKPSKLMYIFGKGFCLQVEGFGSKIVVTSKEKNLKVYLVHKSTDTRLISDKESLLSQVEFGVTSNTTFDYNAVELFYKVHDNTVFDGKTCIDYRRQEENYGDCNYKALATHIHHRYGCYPPWMRLIGKGVCEKDGQSNDIGVQLLNDTSKELITLNDGVKLDIMKQCLPPCYLVEVLNYCI